MCICQCVYVSFIHTIDIKKERQSPSSPHFHSAYLLLTSCIRLLAPFKLYNPHPRICIPSIAVKVGFLDGVISNCFKLLNAKISRYARQTPICTTTWAFASSVTSFCSCLLLCNILQPLHTHILDL